jgi:hypothetical protein
VENQLGGDYCQTGKLTWRQRWQINLAATPHKLENYHGARQQETHQDTQGIEHLLQIHLTAPNPFV